MDDPAWLSSLQRLGMKLGLENMRALCELLDHPERSFRTVLVAGTNGKGSVCAMIESVLRRAGLRVGFYSSPHLVRPHERIRIGGADLPDPDWDRSLRAIRAVVERNLGGALPRHPTYFEVMTAMAFDAFRHARVEWAVLEVGLGGRFDATNVSDPALSLVCGIDLDHQEQLGSTLASIASEKAGVFRTGGVALTGEEKPEALSRLQARAADLGCRFETTRESVTVRLVDDGLAGPPPEGGLLRADLRTPEAERRGLAVPLPGRHQSGNLALAVRAVELLARAPEAPAALRLLDDACLREGLAATRWPGRLEWVAGRPSLLLDSAHNPAGAVALARALDRLAARPRVLLFAAMHDKDVAGMAGALQGSFDALVTTRPPLERAAPSQLVLEAFRTSASTRPPPGEAVDDLGAALSRARTLAGPDGVVCVAGSIFLVGAVKELLESASP